MNNLFSKFENFGIIATPAKRKELAQEVFAGLQRKPGADLPITDEALENFASAVNEILSNETMKELCGQDHELAEEVTKEVLDFINKTKRQMNIAEYPFEQEEATLTQFKGCDENTFAEQWQEVGDFLTETYTESAINLSFYSEQFENSLKKTPENEHNDKPGFQAVKEHLAERWEKLLFARQTKYELDFIDKRRKEFCEELYKRIEELKRLQDALEPFTNELGRLWDMTKGNWQKVNFEILKQFAELLKSDKAINELAEMLGRMRQAEKEFEEELFSIVTTKVDYKAVHASKSDLIGVHESDDLSSLLPAEAALLADSTLETIFFKKFAEKKLQTFEYESKLLSYREEESMSTRQKEKEEKKGPFIICVDTSGSMHGTPETVAKTLCFALLKLAIRDNRKCYLISFSTSIETLNLTDLKNSMEKIIQFLSMSFNGGTDQTPALQEALRMLSTNDFKKADIVMISDFVMASNDRELSAKINIAQKSNTKFHSLVIGESKNSSVIKDFDSNWLFDPRNPDAMLMLVKGLSEI